MPFEPFQKKKCVIKKLDFENCIVTNSKTTARGRKKLRARITREIEDVPDDDPLQLSPVFRNRLGDRRSPVLLRRRKVSFCGEENAENSIIEEPRSPSSPVFKLCKKSKMLGGSPIENAAAGGSTQEGSSSCMDNSYQIEDATTTQESKDSVKISSVDSADPTTRNDSICSVDSTTLGCRDSPARCISAGFGGIDRSDSKRPHKKNRLLRRLHKLQQKQASEKLLWQHQNRKNSTATLCFSVLTFWRDEHNFYLKCIPSPAEDFSVTFLVVDDRWVPNLRHLKKSSVLRLHPPWQKVTLEGSNTTVLTNVICLDVLDGTEEVSTMEKRTFESVPAEPFETVEKLFVESLFRSSANGFLC